MSKILSKENLFFPLAVIKNAERVLLFYTNKTAQETELFVAKIAQDGLNFTKLHQLEIVRENGKKEKLSACDNFSFFNVGDIFYVTYVRANTQVFSRRKHKTETVIAHSRDLKHFEVVDGVEDGLFAKMKILSNHKHKGNFLAYYGGKTIGVAASRDLKIWHKAGELILPRRDHFDSHEFQIVDVLTTVKGILVIYEAKKNFGSSRKSKVGAALFSLAQPYKLLWRSDAAIWEKTIDAKDFPLRPLGAVATADGLRIYWAQASNEIAVTFIEPIVVGMQLSKPSACQLKRHPHNPIIQPHPKNKWECEATFNPAALHLENKVHLIYRAIGKNGVSVLGYAASSDGFAIDERLATPAFAPAKYQTQTKDKVTFVSQYMSGGSVVGCEDPRITQIGNRIYMTYVAFDGCNPPGVALTSISVKDFLQKNWKWKRPVLISKAGQIQKNWMLFPQKINGKYAILHSITPNISIEYLDNLDDKEFVIHSSKKPGKDEHRWDNIVRGAGAPPMKTKHGWLVLYHAMDRRDPDKYKVGAMILDYNDPSKILYRSYQPVLEPVAKYENEGAKSGVVYVCGAIIKEDTLFVYYGGSDSVVCVATADINEFLDDIIKGADKKPVMVKKINKPKYI